VGESTIATEPAHSDRQHLFNWPTVAAAVAQFNNNVAMNVSTVHFSTTTAGRRWWWHDNGSGGVGTTVTNTTSPGNTTGLVTGRWGIGNFGELTLKNSIIANSGTRWRLPHWGGWQPHCRQPQPWPTTIPAAAPPKDLSPTSSSVTRQQWGSYPNDGTRCRQWQRFDVGDDGVCIAAP